MTKKTRIVTRNCENQLLFHNSISVVLSEFPNEMHDKHWCKRLITKEPCLKHFPKNVAQAPKGTWIPFFSSFFVSLHLFKEDKEKWKKLLLSWSLLVQLELQNSSPRVLCFRVCHCDMGSGTDDLRVLADDGLKGFIPVNHGTKNQRLDDHRGENKHGKMYRETLD